MLVRFHARLCAGCGGASGTAHGRPTRCASRTERRALLEALDLNGSAWRTPDAFDDGEALFEATRAHGLEGVVAKKRSERYRPGERGWVKTKHRAYWRFGQELELARRRRLRAII